MPTELHLMGFTVACGMYSSSTAGNNPLLKRLALPFSVVLFLQQKFSLICFLQSCSVLRNECQICGEKMEVCFTSFQKQICSYFLKQNKRQKVQFSSSYDGVAD